eukprot:2535703-Ditylum_brightwellii.AAC.1
MKEHLMDKYDWSEATYNKVEWTIHGQNLMMLQYYQHKFFIKLISEWLPVNKASYNPIPIKTCPCCRSSEKIISHFITCPSNPQSRPNPTDYPSNIHPRRRNIPQQAVPKASLH